MALGVGEPDEVGHANQLVEPRGRSSLRRPWDRHQGRGASGLVRKMVRKNLGDWAVRLTS
jgi:hypothetical protein